MAHFHASVSCLSRSRGLSAVAAAAYRSGQRGVDQRTGVLHDFSRRKIVSFDQLFVPNGALALSRFEYWNLVESTERRKNSTVARDLVLSLPWELPESERIELISLMARWISARHQCLVDAVMHDPSHKTDPRNFHAHLLMSTRRLTSTGFAEKCRELDDRKTGPAEILGWREKWSGFVNEALERHQVSDRVDHRSHRIRGLLEVPTIREGRGPEAPRRKWRNRVVQTLNRQLTEATRIGALVLSDGDLVSNIDKTDQRRFPVVR